MQTGMAAQTTTRRTRDELEASLADDILSGRLGPGSRLPSERKLSLASGVSRPTVREVVGSLQARGLVEINPGRGVFVREPSALAGIAPMVAAYWRSRATPQHLLDGRRALEEVTAAEAARNAVAADVDALERVVVRCENAPHVLEMARHDISFHFLIARTSGNPVLEILFGSLAPLLFELLLRSLSDPAVKNAGIPQHRLILEAIRRRDPEAARAAMHDHMGLAERMFGADYKRPLSEVAQRALEQSLGSSASLEALLEQTLQDAFAAVVDMR
jgi:GntR family transcriptional repressor for pyruvate dehydrogenase complex